MADINKILTEISDSIALLSKRVRTLESNANITNSRLAYDAYPGDTQIRVTSLPHGEPTSIFAIIEPFTTKCEVRRVSSFSGRTATLVKPLDYYHSRGKAILWTTDFVLNVRWFGAIGDGVADDATAISMAVGSLSEFSSGINKYVVVYFPPGTYKTTASINLTNKRYFMVCGDGYGLSRIVSHATGKPALDLIGSRFFDIRDITIGGDQTNRPSVAIFLGRTISGPNCGNCWFDSVALDGYFEKAGFYDVNAEVIHVTNLRSGPANANTPYIYWVGAANGLSVTSDYDSLSFTYTGAAVHRFSDWWLNGGTGTNIIRFGDRCHAFVARSIYCNSYGGTGYAVVCESDGYFGSIGIILDIGGEGSFAGGMKITNANGFSNFDIKCSLLGMNCQNFPTLYYGVFHDNGGTGGGTVTIDASLKHVRFERWYTTSADKLVITRAEGCYFEHYSNPTGNITISQDYGGNIFRDLDTSPHTTTFRGALAVGSYGTAIKNIIVVTENKDPSSIAPGTEATLTFTTTGSALGDVAFASPRGGLEVGLVISKVIVWNNSVNVHILNTTGSAIDPAARDWTVAVICK